MKFPQGKEALGKIGLEKNMFLQSITVTAPTFYFYFIHQLFLEVFSFVPELSGNGTSSIICTLYLCIYQSNRP